MKTSDTSPSLFHTDWKIDFQNAIRTEKALEELLQRPIPTTDYPLLIPRPLAHKIKELGPNSPLWRQFIPAPEEQQSERGKTDPIGDQLHARGNGIIHRYKNRILFSPTEVCPVLCRYCFRKNELLNGDDIFKANKDALINYLSQNPQVEEVILTGGDPLILSNSKIEQLLEKLTTVPSLRMVRFHSRTPVILPNRINAGFLALIDKYAYHFDLLTLVIHTNHTSEWTPHFLLALEKLRQRRIHLLSQSVLLKGVNNHIDDLKFLFRSLVKYGVQPYYLHHPDPVKGGMHFSLSLEEGQELYQGLKQELSGFVLPRYVIELPHGKGKTMAAKVKHNNQWQTKDGDWITWHPEL